MAKTKIRPELYNLWKQDMLLIMRMYGIRQEDLAEMCGVSRPVVSNWFTSGQMNITHFLASMYAIHKAIDRWDARLYRHRKATVSSETKTDEILERTHYGSQEVIAGLERI